MTATIRKWGNSLALRLPRAVAAQIRVGDGDAVELKVDDNGLVVRPARKRYRLAALLRGITPRNARSETDWGRPVGKELL